MRKVLSQVIDSISQFSRRRRRRRRYANKMMRNFGAKLISVVAAARLSPAQVFASRRVGRTPPADNFRRFACNPQNNCLIDYMYRQRRQLGLPVCTLRSHIHVRIYKLRARECLGAPPTINRE